MFLMIFLAVLIGCSVMINLFKRSHGGGITAVPGLTVARNDWQQLAHFLLYFEDSALPGCTGLYVANIAFIRGDRELVRQVDKSPNRFFAGEGLHNWHDLSTLVMPFRVWQEENFFRSEWAGCQVDQFPVFSLPNGMKLCFEPCAPYLKYGPPKELASAVCSNMLWNDGETFTDWFVRERFEWHIERRLSRTDAAAE